MNDYFNQFIGKNSICDSAQHSRSNNLNDFIERKATINNLNAVIIAKESIIDDDATINQNTINNNDANSVVNNVNLIGYQYKHINITQVSPYFLKIPHIIFLKIKGLLVRYKNMPY